MEGALAGSPTLGEVRHQAADATLPEYARPAAGGRVCGTALHQETPLPVVSAAPARVDTTDFFTIQNSRFALNNILLSIT
jgi:hypothetical protein